MSISAVVIQYGGAWNNNSYTGGENRAMLIQLDSVTYDSFSHQIHDTFVGVRSEYPSYCIRCFIPSPLGDGTTSLLDVKNDIDLKFCLQTNVRYFYATIVHELSLTLTPTLKPPTHKTAPELNSPEELPRNKELNTHSVCGETSESVHKNGHNYVFSDDHTGNNGSGDHIDYLASDHADHEEFNDDVSMDSLDADPPTPNLAALTSVKHPPLLPNAPPQRYIDDDCLPETIPCSNQLVIPGALFRATIPVKESEIIELYGRDYIFVGATFESKEKLIIAVGMYHLKNKVELFVKRSNSKYYYVRCKHHTHCRFLIRSTTSRTASFWRVTHFQAPHTCHTDLHMTMARTMSAKVIGAYFAPKLMNSGSVLRPKEMQAHLLKECGFVVKYHVVLAARNCAIRMIYGDAAESFQLLPSYLHMVKESNPGSFVALQTDKDDVFQYCVMALGACISGFLNHCRPVIIIYATHLKGDYKGVMFVATAMDGNEQLVPLAFGIGDKENDNAWKWFLARVRDIIGCPHDLLFVSDQHVSISNAVSVVFPEAAHGLCYFHLRKNLAKFGSHVLPIFGNAAYCFRKDVLDRYMLEIEKASPAAHSRLIEIKPEMWSRSYCPVRRYKFLTSNYAESVNGVLRWARRLPVCTLLECARTLVCDWFVRRREDATLRLNVENNLSEKATKQLYANSNDGQHMTSEVINATKFCVRSGGKRYIVDLATTSCSCREFDLMLIPCPHAAAAITKSQQSLTSYVSVYYSTKALLGTYSMDINATPDRSEWIVPDAVRDRVVIAPNNPNQAGRPRTCRIKSFSESSSRLCGRCNQRGHNQTTCTAYLTSTSTGGSQVDGSRKRRPKSCSVCHQIGHTKRTCKTTAPNV